MLVTGDFISAEEAREKGLINRVVAPEALDDAVEAIVTRIVAKPRVAVAVGKALFYRQLEQGLVVARNQHDEVVGVSLHIIWKVA